MAVQDWFPVTRNNSPGWRLDIVSLLAVIGETSVAEHAQPLTSTWLCLLPRLIPATQALLKSTRPTRLPASNAIVVGVFSGTRVDSLNYFADLLHNIADLKPFEFREYDLDWSKEKKRKEDGGRDLEAADQAENHKSMGTFMHELSRENRPPQNPRVVRSSRWSPLTIITISSFLASVALLVWAACIKDAVACLSIFAVSVSASLGCLGQWWKPKLAVRPSDAPVPRGDIVIRTREGAFLVVHCREEVARELYIGTEECEYLIKGDNTFKAASGIGIFLLMIGVVLLGNCNWTMQAAIGSLFIILNGAYWLASLAPKPLFWDMSRFDLRPVEKLHLRDAHLDMPSNEPDRPPLKPNFTRTMWYAIQATGDVKWVARSDAAPSTDAWKTWLRLAHENRKNPNWDAVGEKNRLMKKAADEEDPDDAFGGGGPSEKAPPDSGLPPPVRRSTNRTS